MDLSTEEPAASWLLKLFGEVGRNGLNNLHWDKIFDKIHGKKLSRENSSKTIQLEFFLLLFCFVF